VKHFFILFSIFLFLFIGSISLSAQTPTIGLKWNSEEAYDGYMLFSPMSYPHTYLINNCGEKVHEWVFDKRVNYTSYLLANGDLARISIITQGGRYLEQMDWDGNMLWSYKTVPGENELIHSDFQVLPNGNYLVITAQRYPDSIYLGLGGDPDALNGFSQALYEAIVEFEPLGMDSAGVVWRWSFIDHLIQNVSDTLPNYGSIPLNPQRLDINHPPGITGHSAAYQHFNGIDYNPDLDQIAFSCWGCSEIYIIDHSTTTDEAATDSGGNSGKGGDLLWRWGNPRNYDRGDSTDQKLFGQHNPEWLDENTPYPGFLSVHDNGNGRPEGAYSRAIILEMSVDSLGLYPLTSSGYLPDSIFWSWQGEVDDSTYYSQYMSTVDIQPNGSALICEAVTGRIFEVTPEGSVAWFYQNPVTDTIQSQGDPPTPFSRVYRTQKYDAEYEAFIGRDLTPQGTLEDLNWVSDSCMIFENPIIIDTMITDTTLVDTMQIDTTMIDTSMIDTMQIDTTMIDTSHVDTTQIDTTTSILPYENVLSRIYPNPSRDFVWVNDVLGEKRSYRIIDLYGKVHAILEAKENVINLSGLSVGSYFIQSMDLNGRITWSEKLLIMH